MAKKNANRMFERFSPVSEADGGAAMLNLSLFNDMVTGL
jgi:hypothetical protein